MIKKQLLILVTLIIITSIFSCSLLENPNVDVKTTPTPTATLTPTPTPTATSTATPTPTTTPNPTVSGTLELNGITAGDTSSDITFTITATVDTIPVYFSVDNGATWTKYNNAVTINNDGNYDILARQTDSTSNELTTDIITVNLDKTAPDALPVLTKNDSDRIHLTWNNSQDDDFSTIKIYKSTSRDISIDEMTLIFTGTTETSFEDTDVLTGTKYYYKTVVSDNLGNKNTSTTSFAFFPYMDARTLLPEALEDLSLSFNNNSIYILGGSTASLTNINRDVYQYDLSTDAFQIITETPVAINQFEKCHIINNKLYIFGGSTLYSGVKYAYNYDLSNDIWNSLAEFPYYAVGIQSELYNNDIYLCAGFMSYPDNYSQALHKYSINDNTYTTLESKPTASDTFGSSLYNGKIYVFSADDGKTLVEIYDIATNTWSNGLALNTERHDYATVIIQDKIYLLGGYDSYQPTDRIDEYDITNNVWISKSPLPYSIYGISAIPVNNDIYIIGGRNGNILEGTIKVYKPLLDN